MNNSPIKENRIVQLNSLVPHPRNFRGHPKTQIDNLTMSLLRFGQGRSVVVQDGPEKMIIVAGHGIVEAAQALQWTELRADILPASWTEDQITGYLLADNLHSQEAVDDSILLSQLLQEQQDAGYDLASLGSDDETLRDMLASMHPPTLDELTAQYGDEPEDNAFWPVIRVKVSPETKELYDLLMEEAEGTDEGVKFTWLLERVNIAVEDVEEEEVPV